MMDASDREVHEAPEYLIGRAQRALASDPRTLELGLSIAIRENEAFVIGKVASERRRAVVTQVLRDALPGIVVHNQPVIMNFDQSAAAEHLD